MTEIAAVAVIVPARDEELLLPTCLEALAVAAAKVDVPVHIVVALDRCRDGSRAVVDSYRGVTAIEVQAGSVGVARAAAALAAIKLAAPHRPGELWLASTDADSAVPAGWLSTQLRLAADGWEVVVGTVAVTDWSGHHDSVRRAWSDSYQSVEHHSHIHGANLGMTASSYLAAGGFAAVDIDEDVALVARLSGRRMIHSAAIPVVTSARRTPRASGGFGDHLRSLDGVPEAS